MLWYGIYHVKYGRLCHPVDSEAWKALNNNVDLTFAYDPRTVRLVWQRIGLNHLVKQP